MPEIMFTTGPALTRQPIQHARSTLDSDPMTPGGTPARAVQITSAVGVQMTPGGMPIETLRLVDEYGLYTPDTGVIGVQPEIMRTPDGHTIEPVRIIAGPERSMTLDGYPITQARLVDPSGTPGATRFNFMGGTLPAGAALARASAGWYFNNLLALTSAAINVARFTYDPTGAGLLGLLVEPTATNSIRNASAGGAVPGSPGTMPTNWGASTSVNGVTRTIVGTGTEDGIPYVDIQYSGTPSVSTNFVIDFDASLQIPALVGQSWVDAKFLRIVAGSLTNVLMQVNTYERDSGGVLLLAWADWVAPTSAALKTQRFSAVRTLTQALTAYVTSRFVMYTTLNQALNVTLRIGLPELVLAPVITSPIVTTTVAVARAADVLLLSLPNGTYTMDILRAAGLTSLPGTVVSGGLYAVPTHASPLQSVTATRTA